MPNVRNAQSQRVASKTFPHTPYAKPLPLPNRFRIRRMPNRFRAKPFPLRNRFRMPNRFRTAKPFPLSNRARGPSGTEGVTASRPPHARARMAAQHAHRRGAMATTRGRSPGGGTHARTTDVLHTVQGGVPKTGEGARRWIPPPRNRWEDHFCPGEGSAQEFPGGLPSESWVGYPGVGMTDRATAPGLAWELW